MRGEAIVQGVICLVGCMETCVVLQVLSKNRWTVLYCTLLAKAESEADRDRIEEEMSTDPEKKAILKACLSLSPSPSPSPLSLASLLITC